MNGSGRHARIAGTCRPFLPPNSGLGNIAPCAADAQKLCGTITWSYRPADAPPGELLDIHNTDAALRSRFGLPLGLADPTSWAEFAKARGTANIADLDASSPFGRVSVPEDVAAACVWLVSDANPYANGQKINIDGGNF